MDAKMNSISSVLPDVNLRSEKAAPDLKTEKGPSFNSVLNHAQKSEAKVEAKADTKVNRAQVKAERVNPSPVESQNAVAEDSAPQQPMKVVKDQNQKTESLPVKGEMKGIDDKAGVIAQSYDGIAVSYPLSKIAKDSLDEKTVTKLKEAGLWDLPTLVMAQPSEKLMMMKEVSQELKGQVTFPMAKPIAQFMASLENELGIEPDRLVQAFQQLPPGQLSEAPEKTMSQVVKNLGLNSKDEARATALFSKMLSQMKSMENESMNPTLLATIAGVAGTNVPANQVGEKVANPVDEKASLKGKAQVATARYAQNTGTEKSVLASQAVKSTDVTTAVKETPSEFKSQLKETTSKDVKLTETPSDYSKAAVTNTDSKGAVVVSASMTPVENQVVQTSHSQAPDVFAANQMSAHQNQMEDKSVKEIVKGSKEAKETLTVKGAPQAQGNVSQIATQDSPIVKPDVAGSAVTGGGIANAELKAGNDNSKHEAIRSIVNNAQMLAQKGGGEIRMTLKPDHLGEIQLKVAMEGNRVNVSMTAERGEVKKLIEQSVHELRHGLATHNLSMDKLDVSVGNRDTGSFKGEPGFNAAKDFANQFHQQQSNKREMMEDLSSLRGNALKTMTAMDRSPQSLKSLGSRASGRLNVVA